MAHILNLYWLELSLPQNESWGATALALATDPGHAGELARQIGTRVPTYVLEGKPWSGLGDNRASAVEPHIRVEGPVLALMRQSHRSNGVVSKRFYEVHMGPNAEPIASGGSKLDRPFRNDIGFAAQTLWHNDFIILKDVGGTNTMPHRNTLAFPWDPSLWCHPNAHEIIGRMYT